MRSKNPMQKLYAPIDLWGRSSRIRIELRVETPPKLSASLFVLECNSMSIKSTFSVNTDSSRNYLPKTYTFQARRTGKYWKTVLLRAASLTVVHFHLPFKISSFFVKCFSLRLNQSSDFFKTKLNKMTVKNVFSILHRCTSQIQYRLVDSNRELLICRSSSPSK